MKEMLAKIDRWYSTSWRSPFAQDVETCRKIAIPFIREWKEGERTIGKFRTRITGYGVDAPLCVRIYSGENRVAKVGFFFNEHEGGKVVCITTLQGEEGRKEQDAINAGLSIVEQTAKKIGCSESRIIRPHHNQFYLAPAETGLSQQTFDALRNWKQKLGEKLLQKHSGNTMKTFEELDAIMSSNLTNELKQIPEIDPLELETLLTHQERIRNLYYSIARKCKYKKSGHFLIKKL